MRYLRMERLFQVLQDGSRSCHAAMQMIDTEALQRLHPEVLVKLLLSGLFGEYPFIHLEGTLARAEVAFEVMTAFSVIEHLLGLEGAHQFLDIVVGSFTHQELARRDIEEADAARCFTEVDGTEEIVFLVVQHVIAQRHTRRHQFCDASFDEFFCQFRIFQLIANRHALASSDELGQVGVEGVVRKSCHLVAFVIAVVTMGEGDTQYLCGNDGILAIRLVEVATTEQQQSLRVFCLEVEELFHHRSELLTVVSCHATWFL